jgi:predicted RNase H-like nuclease (RuvC/YqgF family)
MDDGFELLEQRIHKAAEALQRLKKENRDLGAELEKVRPKLQEAEKKMAALEKERASTADGVKQLDSLQSEVKSLKREREEVKQRIGKLVDLLDGLE